MTQTSGEATESIDELGPVDWIVVEFPGSRFKGEIVPALEDLVNRDIVRILDLLIMKKDDDGTLEAFEISDLDSDELGSLRSYETALAMLLSADDVEAVAAAVEPGSTAAVLVWENLWAAPFGSAVRRAGVSSSPVAGSRSRHCWRSSRKTKRSTRKVSDMGIARRRMRRAAVIGPAPVARVATTAATAAVVVHGVNRRQDRRQDRRR